MSEMPFMQMYWSDYFGDTRHLTCEQHGAYLQLIGTMWTAGGTLPADPRKLAKITGCTPSRWAKISPEVMAFFILSGDVITHKRSLYVRPNPVRSTPPYWHMTRFRVLERDNYTCVYCGDENGPFEVDHVKAVKLGGGNEDENLVCACQTCNRRKGAKTLDEFMRSFAE